MKKKITFTNVLDMPETKEKMEDYIPSKVDCWVHDMPDKDYFRLPRAYYSSSGIMQFYSSNDSARTFKYIQKCTPALQIGTYVHNSILDPKELESDRGRQVIHDLKVRFPAKYDASGNEISPSAMEVANHCVHALMNNDEIMEKVNNSDKELTGLIKDKYFGGSTRIKCDAIDHDAGVLYDIKTSTKSFEAFKKSAHQKNGQIAYYIQAAHYLSVANLINYLNGDPRRYTRFDWLYVGKKDYSTGIVECPPELLELGRARVKEFYQRMLGERFQDEDYSNI